MYNEEFSKIYDEYGWDFFSITMGKSILEYFKINKKNINNHLDFGCGVGTLCNYFYNSGINTKGIDISKSMLKIAKNKNKDIEFIESDITNYQSDEKYDLITMTCDTINHILDPDALNSLFENISNMLNEDGYLIFDILNQDSLSLNTDIISKRDNGINVYYYITKEENNIINTNVNVKENNKSIIETNIKEKLYSLAYIKELLKRNNLDLIQANKSILNEKQRFEDKLYIICKKNMEN